MEVIAVFINYISEMIASHDFYTEKINMIKKVTLNEEWKVEIEDTPIRCIYLSHRISFSDLLNEMLKLNHFHEYNSLNFSTQHIVFTLFPFFCPKSVADVKVLDVKYT